MTRNIWLFATSVSIQHVRCKHPIQHKLSWACYCINVSVEMLVGEGPRVGVGIEKYKPHSLGINNSCSLLTHHIGAGALIDATHQWWKADWNTKPINAQHRCTINNGTVISSSATCCGFIHYTHMLYALIFKCFLYMHLLFNKSRTIRFVFTLQVGLYI